MLNYLAFTPIIDHRDNRVAGRAGMFRAEVIERIRGIRANGYLRVCPPASSVAPRPYTIDVLDSVAVEPVGCRRKAKLVAGIRFERLVEIVRVPALERVVGVLISIDEEPFCAGLLADLHFIAMAENVVSAIVTVRDSLWKLVSLIIEEVIGNRVHPFQVLLCAHVPLAGYFLAPAVGPAVVRRCPVTSGQYLVVANPARPNPPGILGELTFPTAPRSAIGVPGTFGLGPFSAILTSL